MGARVVGSGSHLPSKVVTNAALEKIVDTTNEWIVQRTGIRTRHLLSETETPSDMGVEAGRRALERAGLKAKQMDMLLVATNFPDMICPGSAPFIAEGLGFRDAPFFDLKAGCTGFVYGLAMADAIIQSGLADRLLLVGIEALSRVTDWAERRTCVLFGDGAGAVVLEAGSADEGVLGSRLFGDPSKTLLLHLPAGGTRTPPSTTTLKDRQHFVMMEGAGVFRSATPMMEKASLAALDAAGLTLDEIDWIIPHQANMRIIKALVKRLGVPEDRVIVNLDRVANTSTASIPIALDEALRDGRVKQGHTVLLTAFGAGVTYGATVLRI